MASKLAKKWLRSIGHIVPTSHNNAEWNNFSAGSGTGRYAMPLQIIKMVERSGDSKQTIGYANDLADARKQIDAMRQTDSADAGRGGASHMRRNMATYYVRDIRTDKIYRV